MVTGVYEKLAYSSILIFCPFQDGDFATTLTFDVREREKCVAVPVTVDAGVEMLSVHLELLGEPGGRILLRPSVATIEIISKEMYNRGPTHSLEIRDLITSKGILHTIS